MRTRNGWIAVPLALALAVLAGCDSETVVSEAEEEGAVAEALILGETVTLQNEVQRLMGPNSATIGADETLVIALDAFERIEEGGTIQVTGTVVEFVMAEVESEYGIEFDESEVLALGEFENGLAVVADDVIEVPETPLSD